MVISCPDEDDSGMVSVNGGNQLEIVDEFCYLGSFLVLSRSCDKDVSTRIGKASEAFTCMCSIWKSKRISNTHKDDTVAGRTYLCWEYTDILHCRIHICDIRMMTVVGSCALRERSVTYWRTSTSVAAFRALRVSAVHAVHAVVARSGRTVQQCPSTAPSPRRSLRLVDAA